MRLFIIESIQKVFSKNRYIAIAAIGAVLMFGVLIFLPVGRVSERAFYYQVTSLDSASLAVMAVFSIVLGVLLATNVYLFRKAHESKKATLGGGVLSTFASFIAGMFGSAVCPACLAILLGFIGIPTITFLLAYQKEFFLLSAAIALISLYFASKAVVAHETCKLCQVNNTSKKRPKTSSH